MRNKIILFGPDGSKTWEYLKAHPVPFLETFTIPGEASLPIAATSHGRIAGAICYDFDYPSDILHAGKSGVDLILVPSNDWLQIRNLHAQVARLRAIENGFSLFRPTSNGLSIAVDPYGRLIGASDSFATDEAPFVVNIPIGHVSTLAPLLGDLLAWIALAGALVLTGMGWQRRRAGTATA